MSSKRNKNKKNSKNKRKSGFGKASCSLASSLELRYIEGESGRSLPRVDEGEFDVVVESESQLVAFDENLLDRTRTQWQFGDWQSLTGLDRVTLQNHPDRAKLALLSGAGHLQVGDAVSARQFVRLAQDWGCSKNLIARVLVSGAHNSIGRLAAISGNYGKAYDHFEKSIKLGVAGNDVKLLAKARASHQSEQLGLMPGSEGRLQQLKALSRISSRLGEAANEQSRPIQNLDNDALAFYKGLEAEAEDGNNTPFLLLDSKSLPRSGLHYLKTTLARILGENFSFCEWYQEPGCCKKMPCAMKSYATYAKDTGKFRLRLAKSHDFDLSDPVIESGSHVRQLVLVRDPLFILTSWFVLDQLNSYSTLLRQHGIEMQKIWLAHEKEVLTAAYRIMEEAFEEPTADELAEWLSKKAGYIIGFMNKWVKPHIERPNQYTYLVQYDDIESFVWRLIGEYRERLSEETRKTVDVLLEKGESQFKSRNNPFTSPVDSISAYLDKHTVLFKETVSRILENDNSGYLKKCCVAAE